jgi:pimeloyl-ACP methyl ester carboxylesterase
MAYRGFPVRALIAAAALSLSATPLLAQPRPPGQIVQLNGIALHYEERGQGDPLLLLHGFGACGADWRPIAEALSQNYRVITVDLRGHGWSTNPSNRFSMRQSAEDVAALLDRLGLRRVRAMGISAGGMTLLHLATRQPERIEAMVLIGATTHFPEQARAIMRGVSTETLPPPVLEMFRTCAMRGEAQARALIGQFHAFKDSHDDMAFTPAALATIRARTLIVHGDRDEFFPVSIPVDMYGAIPGSELWIVPQGDHVPIYGERTPEFLRVTQRFLSGAEGR